MSECRFYFIVPFNAIEVNLDDYRNDLIFRYVDRKAAANYLSARDGVYGTDSKSKDGRCSKC